METRSSPSIAVLHQLADAAGISEDGRRSKKRKRLSKSELFKEIAANNNLDRLYRVSRREEARRKFEAGRARANVEIDFVDDFEHRDPIMLEALGEHTFEFVRPGGGSSVTYNVLSLVDYLLCSGVFQDPVSRVVFTESNLKQLDAQTKAAGYTRASVYEASKSGESKAKYAEQKVKEDGLLALDRCAGECVSQMLALVENCEDPEEGEMYLAMHLFPTFVDIFQRLREADREFATQCLKHYLESVMGPPNHPTYREDRADLLGPIVLCLQEAA